MGVQKLPVCKLLDYIILTEHQLSAQFRPDEIIKSGWDFHAISGPETNLPQKAYRAQRHRGGVALLTRNSKRFSVKMTILSGGTHMISGENGATGISSQSSQSGGGGRTSPLLHQAVTWTLVSPLYNGKIHLTGVYIFPDEDQTQEFFEILAVNSNYPSDEPCIYAGDFNAYTAEEIEGHLTPQERHTLPTRTGDVNPAHSPAPLNTSATAPSAEYRGRLLLDMLNSTDHIILNGRFPSPLPTNRPYTFFRPPQVYSILDYNLISKHHASLVQRCEVLPDSFSQSITDHMPIHLHLHLRTSPTPIPDILPQKSAPRTLYHSHRLKDPATKKIFTESLAKKVARSTPTIINLQAQLNSKEITPQAFADTAHAELTSILQRTAKTVLTIITPPSDKAPCPRHGDHSSTDPYEAQLQRTMQHHKNAHRDIQKNRADDEDEDIIKYHQSKFKLAQDELDTLKITKKQNKVLDSMTNDTAQDSQSSGKQQHTMWEYLRKYKNNHATSTLPPKTCSNDSPDNRIWRKGLATLNPLNWHFFRFALGHHLFQHPASPYDEKISTSD